MYSIIIRPVRPTEVNRLQNLNNEVFIDNAKYDPDLVLDWAISPAGLEYFTQVANDDQQICLVAEDTENNRLVGYVAASPKPIEYRKSKYLEINNMGIIPEYRSQGIGGQLIEKCLELAKQRGFDRAFVNSYFANHRAIKFYKSSGFSEIDLSLEKDI